MSPYSASLYEQLLAVISHGVLNPIADMSATISCDHAGADALARAYQRAVASSAELRLVVAAPAVRRVLSITGLDQLIPVYPSLAAALASPPPGVAQPPASGQRRSASSRERWFPGLPPQDSGDTG